jgi:hypothetical protein
MLQVAGATAIGVVAAIEAAKRCTGFGFQELCLGEKQVGLGRA